MELTHPGSITIFGKGFNYSQDGPGNRLVYYLAGCNLRCPWCSNPEGMAVSGPSSKTLAVSELEAEILACRPIFFDGGGVTFTGGEVTLQFEPLAALLNFSRGNSVGTVIETNATSRRLPELFGLLDLLIADCKQCDYNILRDRTGADAGVILDNLEKAAHSNVKLLIRIPLIHGFNDNAASLDGFIKFLAPLSKAYANVSVEILPYHEYGREKWTALGREYNMTDAFVRAETVENFTEAFRYSGIRMINT